MLNYIDKKRNNNKAFTLVEALVAISILMIAIAGPMTLAQKGLSTASLSKDQMIASFLAQDGIEAVKNIRDQIAIRYHVSEDDWLDNTLLGNCMCNPLTENCDFDSPTVPSNLKFCTIDTTGTWTSESIKAGTLDDTKLKISSADDGSFVKYDYSLSGASKFSRYINIKKTGNLNGNEAVVNVRVSWGSASSVTNQKIDIQDFIYNYSENL